MRRGLERLYEPVEAWLWWSVFTLARRRADVELSHRAANAAVLNMWRNV